MNNNKRTNRKKYYVWKYFIANIFGCAKASKNCIGNQGENGE